MKQSVWRSEVALLLLLGCGGSSSEQPDAASDASADSPVGRTVSGTARLHHITDAGETVAPIDLTGVTIAAIAAPGFTTYEGAGTSDGTFSIPNVPEGTYYLQLGTHFIVTSQSTLDLDSRVRGRADPVAATAPTRVTLDVSNLQAWQGDDELQVHSAESGLTGFRTEQTTTGAPIAGATSLAGFVFDVSRAAYRPTIELGDTLVINQLATQTDGVNQFRAVARSFVPAPFQVANGGSAAVSGAFVVPPAQNLQLTWNRPAFDAEIRARSPGAAPDNYSIFATSALAGASTFGLYHAAPDLLIYEPGYGTPAGTVTASWGYGDPFPAAWTRTVSARLFTYRFISLGSATPTFVFSSIDVDQERATLSPGATLDPLVGAVVDPTIEGMDLFGAPTGIGTTPTLVWNAPALGTANRYYVLVERVSEQGGATVLDEVASFETSTTNLEIPPGVIEAGASYVFEIIARATPDLDLEATPFASALPSGSARITTAIATP